MGKFLLLDLDSCLATAKAQDNPDCHRYFLSKRMIDRIREEKYDGVYFMTHRNEDIRVMEKNFSAFMKSDKQKFLARKAKDKKHEIRNIDNILTSSLKKNFKAVTGIDVIEVSMLGDTALGETFKKVEKIEAALVKTKETIPDNDGYPQQIFKFDTLPVFERKEQNGQQIRFPAKNSSFSKNPQIDQIVADAEKRLPNENHTFHYFDDVRLLGVLAMHRYARNQQHHAFLAFHFDSSMDQPKFTRLDPNILGEYKKPSPESNARRKGIKHFDVEDVYATSAKDVINHAITQRAMHKKPSAFTVLQNLSNQAKAEIKQLEGMLRAHQLLLPPAMFLDTVRVTKAACCCPTLFCCFSGCCCCTVYDLEFNPEKLVGNISQTAQEFLWNSRNTPLYRTLEISGPDG